MHRTTAILAGTVALLAVTGARANSAQFTSTGLPVRWHRAVLTLAADPSMYDSANLPDPATLVARAASAWESMPGTPRVEVRAGLLGAIGYDPVRGENNTSGVAVYRRDFPNRLGRPVLAYTVITRSASTGEIYDADVLMDAEHNRFAELPPMGMLGMTNAPNDYQNVLTHEMGHALGLSEDPGSLGATMYPYSQAGEVSKRALHDPDEVSIRAVYTGDVPPSSVVFPDNTGCGAAHVAPTRAGNHGELLVVALALLGLAASRARWARGPVVFVGTALFVAGAPTPVEVVHRGLVRSVDTRMEAGLIHTRAVIETQGVSREVDVLGGRLGDLEQDVYHAPSARALQPGARVDPMDYGLR